MTKLNLIEPKEQLDEYSYAKGFRFGCQFALDQIPLLFPEIESIFPEIESMVRELCDRHVHIWPDDQLEAVFRRDKERAKARKKRWDFAILKNHQSNSTP